MNVTIMEYRYNEHTIQSTEISIWENVKKFNTKFGMNKGFEVTIDDEKTISLSYYNGLYLEVYSNISKNFKSEYFSSGPDFSEVFYSNLRNAKSIIIKSDHNYHDNAEKSRIIIDIGDNEIIKW